MSNLGRAPLGRLVLGRGASEGDGSVPLTDTLTLTDGFTGVINNNPISDTLTLTDGFVGVIDANRLTDTLTFTDTATMFVPSLRDILVFSESMKTESIRLLDTLTFTEKFRFQEAAGFSDTLLFTDSFRLPVYKTFSDTVTFTDQVGRVLKAFFLTPDSITLTDSMSQRSSRQVYLTDTLALADSFKYNATLTKPISDTMAFYDGLVIRSKAATTPTVIVSPPIPPGANYFPPSAVIRVFPHTVLKGKDVTVVLPAANLNDFVAGANKMIVKRMMDGRYVTHRKTSERQRYNWSFTIPRPKASELKLFLNAENGNLIDIEDWEGRLYKAKLLSDSVEFIESRRWEPFGNATEVTLEFEGTRYA